MIRRVLARVTRRPPPEVVDAIEQLLREYPRQASFIADVLIYVHHGNDRHKLTVAWVESVVTVHVLTLSLLEQSCREAA